ncbi:MAG TPA: DUF523 and DUF1722 domain-containing protein [Acidobacteriota bacterium]|nr:DUF523 and DUF1722 domain-containing protein [Acidobacteriota bacterium]
MGEPVRPAGRVRVGISRCLLGDEVRFDGGHKHDGFLTGTLGRFFEWVPVCPEVEAGMGIPRESVRLLSASDGVRMVGVRSGKDFTGAMRLFCAGKVRELETSALHGFILKKDSPSCGMERVRLYDTSGMPRKHGRGMFAGELLDRFPQLPVEEEGRLHDPTLRENFIERVFAYFRWTEFVTSHPRPKDLVQFHTRHKLTILSHDRPAYQQLGRLVAKAGKCSFDQLLHEYGTLLMQALRHRATARKHANVLYHLMGYLKTALEAPDKAELASYIEEYRNGMVPLIVPLTLLLHHFRRHPSSWVLEQTYLNPYPAELMLRNHV